MTVRRLAKDQPENFDFSPENKAWLAKQIAKYPDGRQASAVVPALWQAQKQNDYWLPKAAIERVAKELAMPAIRVMEVATFYSMFNLEPVGKHFVQLCGTTPCMLRGSNGIKAVLTQRIGPANKVTADGLFSWAEVECLGACCNAPMVQINDDYYEDLTPEVFEKLLDDLAAGRPVKTGSQSGRSGSEPEGAVKTLLDPALYDGTAVGAWRKGFDQRSAEAAEAAKAAAAAAAPKPATAEAAPAKPASAKAAPDKTTQAKTPPSADKK